MSRTGEVSVLEIEVVRLTARVKALEEKTQSYSWFLRVLLSALALSIVGLAIAHLTWR